MTWNTSEGFNSIEILANVPCTVENSIWHLCLHEFGWYLHSPMHLIIVRPGLCLIVCNSKSWLNRVEKCHDHLQIRIGFCHAPCSFQFSCQTQMLKIIALSFSLMTLTQCHQHSIAERNMEMFCLFLFPPVTLFSALLVHSTLSWNSDHTSLDEVWSFLVAYLKFSDTAGKCQDVPMYQGYWTVLKWYTFNFKWHKY